jgi:hypothetical protein
MQPSTYKPTARPKSNENSTYFFCCVPRIVHIPSTHLLQLTRFQHVCKLHLPETRAGTFW